MNDHDRQFIRALRADRLFLRKMAHWAGSLVADPIAASGDRLDYVALVPGSMSSAAMADEVLLVERSAVPLDSPDLPLACAARWSALKRTDRHRLVGDSRQTHVEWDGAATPALAWTVGAYRLVVAVREGVRAEIWAPSDLDIAIVPLAETDQAGLSWRTYP